MGRVGWTAIVVLLLAFAFDQFRLHGHYTDAALAVGREIKRAFGF
jgi:hypothetical protein